MFIYKYLQLQLASLNSFKTTFYVKSVFFVLAECNSYVTEMLFLLGFPFYIGSETLFQSLFRR